MDKYQGENGTKHIGIGEATVIEVRDSANSPAHEVVIYHPDFGETTFLPYIQTAGVYRAPRVGDTCYVFCSENFYQYPMAWGHRISPELASQLIGSREDNITVIYSSGPNNSSVTHKVELDDGNDSGIRVTTGSGQSIVLSDNGTISITHKDGASATLDGDKIIFSAGGSTLSIGTDGIEIKSSEGSSLKIGSTIEGKASDTRSKFDEVTVSKHQHTGNVGYPTSPPTPGT
jgi:hypothetical protein